MSGICGIVGDSPGEAEIAALLRPLERRGPEATRSHREPGVALGHTLLATTPEALHEVMPLTDSASGCTITADARLDNRDELIAALDLGGLARTIGDGELILSAYLAWGEDCPTHLLGDFAFAIWDARHERLFCARDHMGMRQFNYCHVPGEMFAFATEDTALLELEGVPRTVSEARIVDFLDDLEGYDKTSTFFDAIHRLPPAHSLTFEQGNCRSRRYWQLQAGPRLELESDEAYAAAFLNVLTEAVACRLRTAGGIGAMLSGGLDSTAVVAIAAGLLSAAGEPPLKTFSAVSRDPAQCLETAAIHRALTIDGLDPTLIDQRDFDRNAAALRAELAGARNPFELYATMIRCIYRTAREKGVKIVLDGGAGDVALTSDNRIAEMVRRGQIRSAIREVDGEIRFWKPISPAVYRRHHLLAAVWVAFAPVWLRSLRRRRRCAKPLATVRPEVARRVGLTRRRQRADGHVSISLKQEARRRAQAILHPNLTSGRERFNQLAGSFGVESRDPFMDIRLIAFCLSLPPAQLQNAGWPKIILRRALAGRVPEEIAWRRGKEHLGSDFSIALFETWPDWRDSMREPASPVGHYLSDQAKRDLASHSGPVDPFSLTVFMLDRFLRRYAKPTLDRDIETD